MATRRRIIKKSNIKINNSIRNKKNKNNHPFLSLDKNAKIISLGYSCAPKRYIDYILGKGETNYFDWLGTPMWAIKDLLLNDFYINIPSIYDISNYTLLKIRQNYNLITNKKLYIRHMHDFDNIDDINNSIKFTEFQNKYLRRGKRFLDILDEYNSNKKYIIFMRLEEPKDRIIHDEYTEKYSKSELEYLKEFSQIIAQRWTNLKFQILYISTTEATKKIDNIIVLNSKNYVHETLTYANINVLLDKILLRVGAKYFVPQ